MTNLTKERAYLSEVVADFVFYGASDNEMDVASLLVNMKGECKRATLKTVKKIRVSTQMNFV